MLKILLANESTRAFQALWLPPRQSLMITSKSTQFTLVDGFGWGEVPFRAHFLPKPPIIIGLNRNFIGEIEV